MKKKIVLLVILITGFYAGNVWANYILNPSFTDGPLGRFGGSQNVTNWTTVDTFGWHHGTSDFDHTHTPPNGVKVWKPTTYLYQNFSVAAGGRYDFGAWAFSYSGDNLGVYGLDGFFKIQWYNAGGTQIGADEEIGRFYGDPCDIPHHAPDPYDIWKFISGSKTAPALAVTCRVILGMTTTNGIPTPLWRGSINFDDVSVDNSFGASNPSPEDNSTIAPYLVTALSWTRPAPRIPGDIIRCDVWFGTDGNMPGTNTKILNKQNASTVAISSLDPHKKYYWRVDCYDPDGAGPEIKSEGFIWKFNTSANCDTFKSGDINQDCYVNYKDAAEMTYNWLECNDLSNSQCE